MQIDDETSRERRHITFREIVSPVVLLMNFGGIVWGAATMSGSVTQLKESVTDLKLVARDLGERLSAIKEDYGARIRILELKVESKEDKK